MNLRTLYLLAAGLLVSSPARAFPPAPHHTLFGVVKNQTGMPLGSGDATLILSGPSGEVRRVPIDASLAPGINYKLEVPQDAQRTASLYTPTALLPGSPFTIRVVIGGTAYLPIQMQGQLQALGDSGKSTRLDLTLGVDSDGDGLPDGWEQDVIDFDPDDGIDGLADVKPGDDIDGDGMTNLAEYIAGTYAFDRLDGLKLEVKEVAGELARLEFVTIPGRTYHITSSADGVTWVEQPFSLQESGVEPGSHHRADTVTPRSVWVAVGTKSRSFYRLYVE